MSKINIAFFLTIVIFMTNLPAIAQKNKTDAISDQAIQMLNQKQYNNAIKLLSNGIQTHNNNTFLYFVRGVTYNESKRYNLALSDFDIVIKRFPNNYQGYFFRGISYGNLNKYNEALSDFNKVIQLKAPEDKHHYLSRTYFFMGLSYYNKGLYEYAVKNLEEALRLNPQLRSAYYYKALAWDKKDEAAEATKAYRVFLRFATNADAAKIQYANKRLAALSEEAETEKPPTITQRKPRKKVLKPAAPKTEVGDLFSAPLGEEAF
jgi:tetratricopeptide (TPR) repeat protein